MSKTRRADQLWLWVFPVAITVAAIGILVSAGGRAEREAVIAVAPAEAQGTVVAVQQAASGRNRLTGEPSLRYTTTVEFTLADGSTYRTILDSEPDEHEYRVGERIAITYASTDPDLAVATERRNDFAVTLVWGWIILALGGVCMAAALWLQLRFFRPRRR